MCQSVNRDFLEFLNEKERSMLKRDAHISKKIVRQHYKVFKDGLKEFAGLNRTYDAYITQRLASHPRIPPGKPFDQLVEHNGAVGSLKARCHDMRNLTVMEQQAQSIAIKKFYQAIVMLEEFEATGELHRSFKSLHDRLKGVLHQAKSIWGLLNTLRFLFFVSFLHRLLLLHSPFWCDFSLYSFLVSNTSGPSLSNMAYSRKCFPTLTPHTTH